jgi:putative phage-type endonuclease
MTTPLQDQSFEAKRRKGIGGSDAAAICGLDPYKTALDVYREKIGEAEPRVATPQMIRGRVLESVVVGLYQKLTDRKVRRQPQRAHPSYPFIIGNIDRQILANGDERGTGLLEVKCPNMRMFMRYVREGLPAHIVVQGQHYLGIYDYEWMDFAIFNADLWKLVHFEIKRDDAFVAGLFEQEVKFWRDYVERRSEPPPVTRVLQAPEGIELPAVEGAIIQRDDPAWTEAADSLAQARTLRETAEVIEEQAKARVKELMQVQGVVEGANLRAYWRTMPGRVTFDKKALIAAKPLDPLATLTEIKDWAKQADLPVIEWAPLMQRLERAQLNLARFDKQGKPFEEFRPYFLKPVSGEEDE